MALPIEKETIRMSLIKNGFDPDEIRQFLEDQISMNREVDKATRYTMGDDAYYKRETLYSKIELLILTLK